MAFGHHADEVARMTPMKPLYHGRLENMKPRVCLFGGQTIVIRPLVHVPGKRLVRFAEACSLPVRPTPCPTGSRSTRTKMKQTLRQMEKDCPQVKINLMRAVRQ